MNREVNLTKRVQTPHGWRYCTVILSANGRVKPDLVIVTAGRKPTKKAPITLNGAKAKRVRLSVGKDPLPPLSFNGQCVKLQYNNS